MSQAIAEAAHLRPHIRLAQAISEFSASLDSSRRTTFKNLQSQSPPTASSVIKLTEEINRQGSRCHKAWRPYAARLVTMLERVRVFAKAGDLLVGGSSNTIASGVWAVLRVSLEEATKFLKFFQQVSDMFMRIGRSAEFQQDLASLFPNCKEIHDYMCEYLIIVLKMCSKIVGFGKKSFMAQLGSSQILDADFKALETELHHWSARVDNKVRLLTVSSALTTERTLKASLRFRDILSHDESKRAAFEDRRLQLLLQLCPRQKRYEHAWRRERKKGTSQWLFRNKAYLNWESSPISSLIWVSGRLGSGKTVLMANVVGQLCCQEGRQPLVASFFCQYNDSETLLANNILGSLAYQMINELDTEAAGQVLQRHDESRATGRDVLDILGRLLPSKRPVYVVIDALDECPLREAQEVLESLKRLSETATVRICCSSRTGIGATLGQTARLVFRDFTTVHLQGKEYTDELNAYIDSEIERRRGTHYLSLELRRLIQSTLAAAAQGMYLWVSLQMDALFPRYRQTLLNDDDILHMLDSLPSDLRSSYDRALGMISSKAEGFKLLAVVAAADRPLNINEVRVVLNVKAGEKEWRSDTWIRGYTAAETIGSLSGGLVEVEEEDSGVHFIHHSVLQHISEDDNTGPEPQGELMLPLHQILDNLSYDGTKQLQAEQMVHYHFSHAQAEGLLGELCVAYLNLDIHRRDLVRTDQSLDGTRALRNIQLSTATQAGTSGKFLTSIRQSRRPKSASRSFDFLQQLQDEFRRFRLREDDPGSFLEYATGHLVQHTSLLSTPIQPKSDRLLLELIRQPPAHLDKAVWRQSLEKGKEILWAARHSHERVFSYLVQTRSFDMPVLEELMSMSRSGGPISKLGGGALRNLVGHYMEMLFLRQSEKQRDLDLDSVEKILRQGASPNLTYEPMFGAHTTEGAVTPLLAAIRFSEKRTEYDGEKVVAALLRSGAVPRMEDIFVTIEKRWLTQLGRLLDDFEHLANEASDDGMTPMGYAITVAGGQSTRILPLLDCLLKHNVNTWTPYRQKNADDTFTTPLISAITELGEDSAGHIISHSTVFSYICNNTTPLRAAIKRRGTLVTRLAKVADIDYPHLYGSPTKPPSSLAKSPLSLAIDNDDVSLLGLLLGAAGLWNDQETQVKVLARSVRWQKLRVLSEVCGRVGRDFVASCREPDSNRLLAQIAAELPAPTVIQCLTRYGAKVWLTEEPPEQQPFIIALRQHHDQTAEVILGLEVPIPRSTHARHWQRILYAAQYAGVGRLHKTALDLWNEINKI